jgi:hypothetical protein
MQTRVEKPPRLGVSASEAARMVGLRSAADFRSNFGDLIKPLPGRRAELYSVAVIRRVWAELDGTAAASPRTDVEFHEKRALERLAAL